MNKNYAIELIKQGKYVEARQVCESYRVLLNWIKMIDLKHKKDY